MFDFADQVVVITGGAGNLGAALARGFYRAGAGFKRFEEVVISGGVDKLKDGFLSFAKEFRFLQTGKVQEYALISVFIATALAVVVLLINSGLLANIFN